jgi:hypothetical protein
MDDIRALLDRQARTVSAPYEALEQTLARARVRSRRTHAITIAVALLLTAGSLAGLLIAFPGGRAIPNAPSPATAWTLGTTLQLRPVLEVIPRGDPTWKRQTTTCHGSGEAFASCFKAAAGRRHITLRNTTEPAAKYILGPVIVDGTEVSSAHAELSLERGWLVQVSLDAPAKRTFGRSTAKAAVATAPLNQIAMVFRGRVVSAPTIQSVISDGAFAIPGLSGTTAKDLASAVGGST